MQVGINCLEIDPAYCGGVNSFTLGLLEGFSRAGNGCHFQVYATPANAPLFDRFRGRPAFDVAVIEDRLLPLKRALCRAASLTSSQEVYRAASNRAFEKIRQRMDAECEMMYTPTVSLSCFDSRRPTLLSMHDIQHVRYPEFFNWPTRVSRRVRYGLSAHHASYFQASSRFIKQDLLGEFPEIAPGQVEVIPEGVDAAQFARPDDGRARLAGYDLPEEFLFCPARLWHHKNHLTILKALKRVETAQGLRIPLVLTGARSTAAAEIFKFLREQSMEYVLYLGPIAFADIVTLYQRAAFLITAVLYESSSLPILEAAAAGVPIIASRTPPNDELGEVLELNLFNSLDAEELARLLYGHWTDRTAAAAQAQHNRERIGAYSWESAARKYVQLFKRMAES